MEGNTDRLFPAITLTIAALLILISSPAGAQTTDEDLDIGWIHRTPELDYVPNSPQPDVDGWPAVDEVVTWQAMVKNWFPSEQVDVAYVWLLDGSEIESGIAVLAGSAHTAIELDWAWTFDRHELTLVIDPYDTIPEFSETNNELTVYTDAISVGFWVEQTVYDYFHQYQHELGLGANSWEDWGQRHVSRWNQMFADAIYPDSPDGVLDRIRCDKIVIVPDDALPLAWGYYPTNHPDTSDHTVDLEWGFPATLLDSSRYDDHVTISDNNQFYYEGSLMHELGHARYLIDVYGFNVGGQVDITEGGEPVMYSDYMPDLGWGTVYYVPVQGLMHGHYTYVDSYSAAALNLIAGHRALNGNCNAPYNLGSFLQDLPDENVLTITDTSGAPLVGASVRVYTATGVPGVWYGKYYDDVPDMDLVTDGSGQVLLGRCPFSDDGVITHYWELCNSVVIVRLEHGGTIAYEFLPALEFNHAYWRGDTTSAHHTLELDVDTGVDAPPAPFVLLGSHPNPFNPSTDIAFVLTREMSVELTLHGLDGRRVTTLCAGVLPAGPHVFTWDGRNAAGRSVASGTYICRAAGGGLAKTHKLTLVR